MKLLTTFGLALILPLAFATQSLEARAENAHNPPSPEKLNAAVTEMLGATPELTQLKLEQRGGQQIETVYIGGEPVAELAIDLQTSEGQAFSALPPELQRQALENAETTTGLITDLALSDALATTIGATDAVAGEVVTIQVDNAKQKRFAVARDWLRSRLTTGVMANDKTLYSAAPKDLSRNQKFIRYLRLAWQFVLVETVHAAIEYYDIYKRAPHMVEFGLSIDVKIEPQIFLGKFNPTQKVKALRNSYGFALEFSFDKSKRRPSFGTRLRREKGSGGLGLPAFKAEAKFFQTDGTHQVQAGKSWYPVSPPLASFVLDRDNHGHYFAQGLTVGLNFGDLIPGSTLTNTFADYQQKEDVIDFRQVPHAAHEALKKTAHAVLPHRPLSSERERPRQCSLLFAN